MLLQYIFCGFKNCLFKYFSGVLFASDLSVENSEDSGI